jgi:predicted ABC-type ATPase
VKHKKFRLFAGPNGSGKSTLIDEVSKEVNIGYFINADVIEALLTTRNYIDLKHFVPGEVENESWNAFLISNKQDDRIRGTYFGGLKIIDNFLTCKQEINSYHAAVIAEFLRETLLTKNSTFSFETVMSHSSKITFLELAKSKGFSTYLYFVCTRDPAINLERVKNRVKLGGHDVAEEKMNKRYYASLELLSQAFDKADRAFIIDSTSTNRTVVLEKTKNSIILHTDLIPDWVNTYLLEKLDFTDL